MRALPLTLAAFGLALFAVAMGGSAQAQQRPGTNGSPTTQRPFLTLDQDRLFAESDFGQRVRREIEERARALGIENRSIETELSAEERALTRRRDEMPADEFRDLADAFDAKVIATRERQDAKARAIDEYAETERQRFFSEMLPVLLEIVRDTGASAILEDRAIILAAEGLDITGEALQRINARIGDGGGDGTGPAPDRDSP